MGFCIECGGGLPTTAKFCPSCGTRMALVPPERAAESAAKTVVAFAVGQNNFGGGRSRMEELLPEIGRHMPLGGRLLAWHGHSGNVAIQAPDAAAVPSALRSASGRDWAVVPLEPVADALRALGPIREEDGVRWTPGLAFSVDRALVVPVVKRDTMAGGRLDSSRRDGGWGSVSGELARQHGGRWTARSWRTVSGLLRQL